MNLEPDPRLEALLGGELKKLPLVAAPRTMIPNVLAVLAARAARPWWQRAWWEWPLAAQAAFLIFALALIACASGGSWAMSDGLATGARNLGEQLSLLADFGQRFAPLTDSALGLAEKFGATLLLYGGIAAAFAYLTCVGAGTAFVRLAWKQN